MVTQECPLCKDGALHPRVPGLTIDVYNGDCLTPEEIKKQVLDRQERAAAMSASFLMCCDDCTYAERVNRRDYVRTRWDDDEDD